MTSTTPLSPGAPNPAYGYVESLFNNTDEFRAMAKKIVILAKSRYTMPMSPVDMAKFKRECAQELDVLKKQFANLVGQANAASSKVQYAPTPPPSRELYGLIADGTEIVDVGSGNCLRLQTESGRLKVTAIDPALAPAGMSTVKRIAREVEAEDVRDKIVTSYNALIAVPLAARDAILEEDGLHMVPDHNSLLSTGCARREGDFVVVQTAQREYRDHHLDIPGYPITAGYKICPSFRSEACNFETGPMQPGEYIPKIDCSPCSPADMNWADMGWKWDGTPFELEVLDGKFYATRRDGSCAITNTSCTTNMCLHVEMLEEAKVCVLLRIEFYRSFIPPHCGDVLRHFAAKVRLVWNGMPVVGPPVLDYTEGPMINGLPAPIDGVITRSNQRDFYVKPHWTLDLRQEDLLAIQDKLETQGKTLRYTPRMGLWEYRLSKCEEVYQLQPIRQRVDKNQVTTMGTVDYLLSLPTIKEIVAVTGRTPDVEGLEKFFLEY